MHRKCIFSYLNQKCYSIFAMLGFLFSYLNMYNLHAVINCNLIYILFCIKMLLPLCQCRKLQKRFVNHKNSNANQGRHF